MPRLCKATSLRERGAALLIVLALVVLVAGLIVAYFSRATSDRPVAQGSFNQSKADQLAASATDNIVGDLRQEIIIGSASPAPTFGPSTSPGPYSLYVPTNSAKSYPAQRIA
jgi:Tfp pilus assembly protein PilX